MFLALFFMSSLLAKETSGQEVLEKTVSFKAEKIELNKLIQVLKEQTGANFIFSSKVIKAGRKISVNASNKKLSSFLEEYLTPLGIKYKMVDNQILLYASGEKSVGMGGIGVQDLQTILEEQERITGVVTDSNGVPLAGASVTLKSNTRIGTSTDAKGRFSIEVPGESAELIISYTGYETKIVRIGNQTEITVVLSKSSINLGDVVVTALVP
jgi:type II secretory pathway component GspD/PulD (secretin)